MQYLGNRLVSNTENPPIACFWGTPYQDAVTGEWKCPSDVNNPNPQTDTKPLIRTPFSYVYSVPNTRTNTNGFSLSSIFDIVKQHPYITATAIGLILWFFFGGAVKQKVAKRLSR